MLYNDVGIQKHYEMVLTLLATNKAGCSSHSSPPSFSIIAHVSIEVPQRNYRVPRWYPFQDTKAQTTVRA